MTLLDQFLEKSTLVGNENHIMKVADFKKEFKKKILNILMFQVSISPLIHKQEKMGYEMLWWKLNLLL